MANMQLHREPSVGMQVEDLWGIQEAKLNPTEKLNACFESIPVSAFPQTPQETEIRSDASLAEAVQILAQNKILSAPVVNVDAPEDASWIDRYLGIVEFAGIAVWILQQSGALSSTDPSESPIVANFPVATANGMSPAVGFGTSVHEDNSITSGDFFEALTSSEFYKKTKVRDISGSFRWAPFLALQNSNSFLTMLILLSKYKMKSIPIVDIGHGNIHNIITQAAVIHMLAECTGLQWFENWESKKLSEIGLPAMSPQQLCKVHEDESVLKAFKLMREKKMGGLPVVDGEGKKAIGNISLRDIQFLLTAPEIYHDYRSITAKNFLIAVKNYLAKRDTRSPMLGGMITCKKGQTVKELIQTLDTMKIQRVYVVDDEGNLEGVITLRDIISRLVYEPPGYFGDFFDGALPGSMT